MPGMPSMKNELGCTTSCNSKKNKSDWMLEVCVVVETKKKNIIRMIHIFTLSHRNTIHNITHCIKKASRLAAAIDV